MAQVTLTIDATGHTTVEVNDVQGPACRELTAQVERLLGTVKSIEHKAEYHDLCGESAQQDMGQF